MKGEKIFICLLIFSIGQISAQKIGGWTVIDSMNEKRRYHAGVKLENGNILITGGYTSTQNLGSNESELFNINTLKWNTFIPMNKGRGSHNLLKLKDGSIIAIGGFDEKTNEILDKNYSQWTYTDTLKTSRWYGQSVVMMQNGNVMIIGGFKGSIIDPSKRAFKECEIFSYLERTWELTAELNTGRYYHTSTVLQDGRILVTGGETINNGIIILNSCEIFNPTTRNWTIAKPMHYSRTGHSATLLNNGKVLIIGGGQEISELYDPLTDTWEEVGRVYLASGHNIAIVLCDEEYLLVVQDIIGYAYRPGWELFSLKELKSIFWGELNRLINDPVIVKIDENRVLFSGGHEFIEEYSLFTPTNFCRLYDLNLTSVKEKNKYNTLPSVFSLSSYPNPFNSSTNVTVELSSQEQISLVVYNTLGEVVDVIHKGELNIGKHIFQYSMNNHSSGVYFVRMYSSKEEKLMKIIYQK